MFSRVPVRHRRRRCCYGLYADGPTSRIFLSGEGVHWGGLWREGMGVLVLLRGAGAGARELFSLARSSCFFYESAVAEGPSRRRRIFDDLLPCSLLGDGDDTREIGRLMSGRI